MVRISNVGIILIIGLGFFSSVENVLGENYVFNMTKDLEEEGNVLNYCIYAFDIVLENCKMIYGGINTPYGDKIK